jgi:glutathione S-transferase
LQRAKHRAWIEFASATLNAIWTFYTAKEEPAYELASKALRERFAQVEKVLVEGPFFGGTQFSLVDAAFAPVFRYFDVFDGASGVNLFVDLPKTRAWRDALAQRLSVREAVPAGYPALLREFVIRQDGVLAKRLRG